LWAWDTGERGKKVTHKAPIVKITMRLILTLRANGKVMIFGIGTMNTATLAIMLPMALGYHSVPKGRQCALGKRFESHIAAIGVQLNRVMKNWRMALAQTSAIPQ